MVIRKIAKTLCIILQLLLIVLSTGCSEKKHQEKYDLREIKRGALVQSISALGQVDSKQHERIISVIDGTIISITAKEGDLVEKGQLLSVLSSQIIEENILHLSEKVNRISEELINAEFEQKNIQNEYLRAISLYKTSSISGKDLEDKKNRFEQYNQIIAIKKNTLLLAKQMLSKESIKLKQTKICSPITGLISSIPKVIVKGANIQTGQLFCEVTATNNFIVNTSFNEFDSKYIFIDQYAVIKGDALGKKELSGKVTAILPKINNGKLEVELTISNSIDSLRLGNTVEAEIITNKKENILYVPIDAVTEKNGNKYLLLYSDNKPMEISVNTGISTIESIEISSNILKAGQKIIIPPKVQ